jgi:hypothetical protein
MNNNANNLFEHIKKSPYFSKRLEDMKYIYYIILYFLFVAIKGVIDEVSK